MGQDNGDQWDGEGTGEARSFDADPDGLAAPPSFDGYDLLDVPLGDLLRGERATLGKSLLDVERELRIRATYIAAIENGDVGAFQSPGFIAGYVRSYARYLAIDPEWTFRRFCEETGFRGIHGQGAVPQQAEPKRPTESPRRLDPNEVMSSSRISYAPVRESVFSRVEPGALGSIAVLLVLALGIGYGAWAILNDIQRLQIAPIDEAPEMPLAQLDPLAGASEGAFDVAQGFDITVPGPETVDRLYRPQALEAPVLTPRDEALVTLNPDEVGTLAALDGTSRVAPQLSGTAADTTQSGTGVQVTQPVDQVMIFATNPTWVRVTSPSGDTIYEATLNRGDSYVVPEGEGVPTLRTGSAGFLYFAVNGVALGPAGESGAIARDVALSADALAANYSEADTEADPELTQVASLVFDAYTVPAPVPVVPGTGTDAAVAEALAYDPYGPDAPVVVLTPGPEDVRPTQRP